MEQISQLLHMAAIWAVPLLLAITLHEAAHAYAAYELGDPTARERGRMSLNPLRHVDPFGTVVLPLMLLVMNVGVIFGYAKPVPVDARRLRDPRGGMALVALAGPASNLLQASIAVVLLRLLLHGGSEPGGLLHSMLTVAIYANCLLAILNMLPIPPLDGGRVLVALLPPPAGRALERFSRKGILVLLLLFLLLPMLSHRLELPFDPLRFLVVGPAIWLAHQLMALGGL